MNWKAIGSVVFVAVILILLGQYGHKKAAYSIAGLILLSAFIMNIDKLKGVFASA